MPLHQGFPSFADIKEELMKVNKKKPETPNLPDTSPIPATLTHFDWLGPADKGSLLVITHPDIKETSGYKASEYVKVLDDLEYVKVLDDVGTVKRGMEGTRARNWPKGNLVTSYHRFPKEKLFKTPSTNSLLGMMGGTLPPHF